MNRLVIITLGLTLIFGYNAFLADRDRKAFEKLAICESFTHRPDCQ